MGIARFSSDIGVIRQTMGGLDDEIVELRLSQQRLSAIARRLHDLRHYAGAGQLDGITARLDRALDDWQQFSTDAHGWATRLDTTVTRLATAAATITPPDTTLTAAFVPSASTSPTNTEAIVAAITTMTERVFTPSTPTQTVQAPQHEPNEDIPVVGGILGFLHHNVSDKIKKVTDTLLAGLDQLEEAEIGFMDWAANTVGDVPIAGGIARGLAFTGKLGAQYQAGVLKAGVDMVGGVGQAITNPDKVLMGVAVMVQHIPQPGRVYTPQQLAVDAQFWQGFGEEFIKPYVTAWQKGKPGEAIGRGAFDIGSLFIGVGEIKAGTKVLDGARAAADATKAATTVSRMTVLTTGLERVQGVIRSLRDLARVKVPPNVIAKVDNFAEALKIRLGYKANSNLEKVTYSDFISDTKIQVAVFNSAKNLRYRQWLLGNRSMLQSKAIGTVVSILKRRNFNKFVESVVTKFKDNADYVHLSDMVDIVRGRINLASGNDVENLVRILREQLTVSGYQIKKLKPSRIMRVDGEDIMYYPRYHIVVVDPVTGLTYEWQIGTRVVTSFFEDKVIALPKTIKGSEKLYDIHDIEYAVFGRMQESSNAVLAQLAKDVKIPEFRSRVARLAQEAGIKGDSFVGWRKALDELSKEATEILQQIANDPRGGPEIIEQFMHK